MMNGLSNGYQSSDSKGKIDAVGFDKMFHSICLSLASNSKCLSRKIGAVLVRDKSVISTGYNGPPRGIPHCGDRYFNDKFLRQELEERGTDLKRVDRWSFLTSQVCPRQLLEYKSGEGLHLCNAAHAERNALINAAREGVKTKGSILYINCGVPCGDCLIEIINAGVEGIVCENNTLYDKKSEYLLRNSKIKTYVFDFLQQEELTEGNLNI